MKQTPPSKLPFDDFYRSIKSTLNYPNIERKLIAEVETYVDQIYPGQANSNLSDYDFIDQFLTSSTNNNLDVKERFRTILQVTNLSIERMERFCEHHFKQPLKSALKYKRKALIEVLLDRDSDYLKDIPAFERFNFSLPPFWRTVLTNKDSLFHISRANFRQKYTTAYGNALEEKMGIFLRKNNLNYEKGKVSVVDNKEVDLAVPSVKDPKFLIMASYNRTTSSNQSSRANEQCAMYDLIIRHNRVHNKNLLFINVIDGGGWLARKQDLRKMYDCCHYCYTDSNIEFLSKVIGHYQH